ncbi:hypothetical protein [Stenotrophomonas maltophilia]|uniref:hypothetical protein n=2 Tax=Stenotrophomonas maltophilia TaxID=40324 RepID=UPI00130E0EB7|nr:hypothetical protein [Stenotrophomonas maltophilia]
MRYYQPIGNGKARTNMGRTGKRRHSLHRTIGSVYLGGNFARESLFLAKANTPPSELFQLFPRIIKTPKRLLPIHGNPSPQKYSELFSIQPAGSPAGPVNEAVWAICRSLLHVDTLSDYIDTRHQFESSILLSKYDSAAKILTDFQDRCGVSLWLAQSWLTLGENAPSEARSRVRREFENAAPQSVAAFMLHYLTRRSESRGAKRFLKDEISAKLAGVDDFFRTYAASRVSDVFVASPKELSANMFFEAQASIIDHYEALIATLQDMATAKVLPRTVIETLERPVAILRRRLNDRRLAPLAMSFGCVVDPDRTDLVASRSRPFELYYQSEYREAAEAAAQFLSETDPTDAAMLTLLARALIRSGSNPPPLSPTHAALCSSLLNALGLTDAAYGEATSIFSNADTHYGQTWARYLRSIVLSCLHQESDASQIDQLRNIVVLDPYISPITLACARQPHVKTYRKILSEHGLYPNTLTAINLLYYGIEPGPDDARISKNRYRAYLGRSAVTSSNVSAALLQLEPLLRDAPDGAKFRALTALSMAMTKAGRRSEALALLIDAHIHNPEVPTALPLDVVIKSLEDSNDWPETIDVPLAFELYNAFSSDSRLAELRFAFEKFQETKSIDNPATLVEYLGSENKERSILYLDRVWTPEVMRHTLLYNGTSEIGEARVAVCRQLAALDPENSTRYLDEIRERVKQQEIAKGTSLLEQSKVYVDIAAIKRSLKAKIGGQYSRYRANTIASNDTSQEIVEHIADALLDRTSTENISLGVALSNVHLVDEIESETDSQFDSIFTEVTHEFLRGDHGLNAYLSTRVRHGVLANTLRKPLADERLINIKNSNGQGYRRNLHWDERLEGNDSTSRDAVAAALEKFSSEFDRIVHELRDERLQITISHGVKDMKQDTKAAFVYRSSNLERRFMQRYAVRSRTMDEFIDVCIDNLWGKTDENLLTVRDLLEKQTKPALMSTVEQLSDAISTLPYSTPVADLRNAIVRAKTQLRLRLDEIFSWFKRSQVYDRQDYQAGLPVDIALNMIRKTAPENSTVPRIDISPYDRSARLPGRTLDGMVDAFYVLISNAIEHSGLEGESLKISVSFDLTPTRYAARIDSSLAPSIPSIEQRSSVESIRSSLNKSDSLKLAQVEGGSGLRKLWRSINSPFYDAPSLDFGFSPSGNFYVEISYNVEIVDENSPHRG